MAWSKKYRYANGSENYGPGGAQQGSVQSGDEGQLCLCGRGSAEMSCDRYRLADFLGERGGHTAEDEVIAVGRGENTADYGDADGAAQLT